MTTFTLILTILGVVFLGLAAFGVKAPWRISWGWLGLFCLYLTAGVNALKALF